MAWTVWRPVAWVVGCSLSLSHLQNTRKLRFEAKHTISHLLQALHFLDLICSESCMGGPGRGHAVDLKPETPFLATGGPTTDTCRPGKHPDISPLVVTADMNALDIFHDDLISSLVSE